jgi:pheromone shutdown protein TraB
MPAAPEAKRAIAAAIVGFLYGTLLSFLSLGAVGAGHGTLVPLLLSSAPISVFYSLTDSDPEREWALYAMLLGTSLVWAALGSLVALAGRGKSLRFTRLVVLLHYASGLAVVAVTGAGVRGLADEVPDFFIAWAPTYLVGQVALWWQITGRKLG